MLSSQRLRPNVDRNDFEFGFIFCNAIRIIRAIVDDDGAQLTSRDLDECHGKWHGSEYRYHVTADYPYFISCFRGRVPAQNKQTPVRRGRGKRSYSWREGARLPDFHEATFQLPLKMGDCKVCRNVNSCFGNSQTYSSTRQSQFVPLSDQR